MELEPIAYKTKNGFVIQQVVKGFMGNYKTTWEIVSPRHFPNFYLGEHGSVEEAFAVLQKHPGLFREAGCS